MSLLEVKNLTCRFRTEGLFLKKRRSKTVFANLSLQLEKGETLGIIGESGHGKSTLAKCIAGLVEPESGTIRFNGINIFPESGNRKLIHRKIQLLFQNHTASLDPRMTIYQSMREAIGINEKNNEQDWFLRQGAKIFEAVGLPTEILHRYPRELSGGQRQRVALARVLAVSPELLILDEPTSSLDVITQVQVLKLLKEVRQKFHCAILYITHDINSAVLFCDRIAVLYKESIIEVARVSDFVRNPVHPYSKTLLSLSGIER